MGFVIPSLIGAGSAIFGAATSTAGIATLAGIGAGLGASKMFSQKGSSLSALPTPLPQAPNPVDSAAKAEDILRKKRALMTRSIYTSPLGVAGQANVARKTLLGQ